MGHHMKHIRLKSQPWGEPVSGDRGSVVSPTNTLRPAGEKIKEPVAQGGGKAKGDQFVHLMLRNNCVEC